jgi:hypothetical protein
MPRTHLHTMRAYCRVDKGWFEFPSWEEILASFAISPAKIVVQGLLRRLSYLEANGSTGLSLPDVGSVPGIAIGRHIIDTERDEIAATQFTVNREIEHCQVTRALLEIQLRTDRPYVTGS